MIRELRIRGLGVIDEAAIPFGAGLTVLTGETGAGKTMVLTGLALIMGEKSEAGMVRSGSERADVDGEWLLPLVDHERLAGRLDEAGARTDVEGDQVVLLLGRTVAAEGRSRAFAGGRSVPASTLADLASALVAVHGQSDQLLLRDPRQQRDLLDRFAGPPVRERLADYRSGLTDLRSVERELADLVANRHEREREAAMLQHGIDEIAAVAPEADEDEELKSLANRLAHAGDLVADVGLAQALLVGGDVTDDDGPVPVSASEVLGRARRSMERAAALDPTLDGLVARFDDLAVRVDDVAADLGAYARGVEADPQRQQAVEERRQQVTGLMRRYGPGLADVLAWWSDAERTVAQVDGTQGRIDQLTDAAGALRAQVVAAAADVTSARRAAAERFGAEVSAELQALAMPDAELVVEVRTTDDVASFTLDGADTVAMLLRPHAGSDLRPLGKGASGGELSRIMLAIEVVLADVGSVPTFVFDEVDAGIGGRVAVEVGRRLARLARHAQVIVVTHLPQVAAFADRHLVVTKTGDGRVTGASVVVVTGGERVSELVRMLSGLEGSESGAIHAAELLELAEQDRS